MTATDWTTDQTLDRSWKQIDTDTFYMNGDRVPCDEKPGDYTTTREVAEPCTVVGQKTTKVTVYTQAWTHELNDDSDWVPVKVGDEDVATYVRDLTAEEEAGCPTPAPDAGAAGAAGAGAVAAPAPARTCGCRTCSCRTCGCRTDAVAEHR